MPLKGVRPVSGLNNPCCGHQTVHRTDLLLSLFSVVVTVDNQPIRLQLCDTAGQVSEMFNTFNCLSVIC